MSVLFLAPALGQQRLSWSSWAGDLGIHWEGRWLPDSSLAPQTRQLESCPLPRSWRLDIALCPPGGAALGVGPPAG